MTAHDDDSAFEWLTRLLLVVALAALFVAGAASIWSRLSTLQQAAELLRRAAP